jgi:hypothetical protein
MSGVDAVAEVDVSVDGEAVAADAAAAKAEATIAAAKAVVAKAERLDITVGLDNEVCLRANAVVFRFFELVSFRKGHGGRQRRVRYKRVLAGVYCDPCVTDTEYSNWRKSASKPACPPRQTTAGNIPAHIKVCHRCKIKLPVRRVVRKRLMFHKVDDKDIKFRKELQKICDAAESNLERPFALKRPIVNDYNPADYYIVRYHPPAPPVTAKRQHGRSSAFGTFGSPLPARFTDVRPISRDLPDPELEEPDPCQQIASLLARFKRAAIV